MHNYADDMMSIRRDYMQHGWTYNVKDRRAAVVGDRLDQGVQLLQGCLIQWSAEAGLYMLPSNRQTEEIEAQLMPVVVVSWHIVKRIHCV